MTRGRFTLGWATLVSVALVACAAPETPPVAYSVAQPIEQRFAAPGPYSAAHLVTEVCDREGHVCDVYYPEELGSDLLNGGAADFRHPVIAWANGSGQTSENYAYVLRHFATWGFIVISARDDSAGTGDTTEDAMNFLIAQSQVMESPFYNHIDGEHIGAAGHSQGGGAVVALMARRAEPFSVFVAFHPSPLWFAGMVNGYGTRDLANARRGAVLFINSVGDGGAADTRSQYEATASPTKAIGVLAFARHDDIMGTPDCTRRMCINGAHGYLGYPTAWFMAHLANDVEARDAFGSEGEFTRPDPDWVENLTSQ